MAYVRDAGGTRSPSYGTPLGGQVPVVRAACAAAEGTIVIRNETAMFRFPFEYLASVEPGCLGKTVVVCSEAQTPFTLPCPPAATDRRVVGLHYAGATGGALAVD